MSDLTTLTDLDTPVRKGGGLGRFPAGKVERQSREERAAQIAKARKRARVEVRDGRKWKVLRLPDAYPE